MRPATRLTLAAVLTLSVVSYAQIPTSTRPQSPTASPYPQSSPNNPNNPNNPQNSPQSTPPSSQPTPSTVPANDPNNNGPTSDSTGTKGKDPAIDHKEKDPKPKADSLPSPGENLDPHIKKGSEDDVEAIGTRNIGGRGIGNWYSVDSEIRMGKGYAMEIEKSAHMVNDPVIQEYVNRVGQNIVK